MVFKFNKKEKCIYSMFSKFQCVPETSTACFEVLGMRGKETVSEAASVTSYGDYMPSLQRQKKKSDKHYFAISSQRLQWKKVTFKLSKSQIQLKIKQSSSLELRSVHYWAWISTKKETARRIKIGLWKPEWKKFKILQQIGYLRELSFLL